MVQQWFKSGLKADSGLITVKWFESGLTVVSGLFSSQQRVHIGLKVAQKRFKSGLKVV